MKTEKIKYPLKNKLIVLVLVAMVPVLYVAIYLILALVNYSRAYDQIVNSMLLANAYNINFKEEMDESLYKLVVSNVTFGTIEEDGTLKDPYSLIDALRTESNHLLGMTPTARAVSGCKASCAMSIRWRTAWTISRQIRKQRGSMIKILTCCTMISISSQS